jgi:aspartyl-tRNA synthetase
MSSEEKPGAALPVHAKDNPNVEAEGAPTKSALKKAAKEAEKAAKKAAAKEKEAAQRAAQAAAADEDKAVDNYGSISKAKETEIIKLKDLTEAHADKVVTFFARVENVRSQSAKLGFLTLREQGRTIQAVLAAAGDDVSKQMVKWAMQNPANSILRVTGLLKKVETPIASATIQTLELAVTRIFEVSRAQDFLPMSVKDAEKPIPESGIVDPEDKSPPVPMHIRLDNRVIDLQADINQAIFTISSAVEVLFTDYMFKSGSRKFNTPKLVGAATEGGAGVFAVTNYFGKTAYLAQSPQFYKQMLIAADCESVFEIGPVFRAENSNTHRHLTEVAPPSLLQ